MYSQAEANLLRLTTIMILLVVLLSVGMGILLWKVQQPQKPQEQTFVFMLPKPEDAKSMEAVTVDGQKMKLVYAEWLPVESGEGE